MKTRTAQHQVPDQLPFLKAVCWQLDDVHHFTQEEMLNRYERGWNYRGVLEDIQGEELQFLHQLAKTRGSWLVGNV